MNRSTPGLPVHHQLLGFTQTHVHRISDAIQSSHPLSSPSPLSLTFNKNHYFPFQSFKVHSFDISEIPYIGPIFLWFFKYLFLFIYLVALGLNCGMWDLGPRPGVEPGFPALRARSLSHWTTRELPWPSKIMSLLCLHSLPRHVLHNHSLACLIFS